MHILFRKENKRLGWLKKKGIETVQRQCKFNIKLNTKTLISIANRACTHIEESSGKVNECDKAQVYNAQKRLLEDIILGCSNGLTLDENKTSVIQPILNEADVSSSAFLAVNHVIKSAEETLGALDPGKAD